MRTERRRELLSSCRPKTAFQIELAQERRVEEPNEGSGCCPPAPAVEPVDELPGEVPGRVTEEAVLLLLRGAEFRRVLVFRIDEILEAGGVSGVEQRELGEDPPGENPTETEREFRRRDLPSKAETSLGSQQSFFGPTRSSTASNNFSSA